MWPFGRNRDPSENSEYEALLAQSVEGLKFTTAAQQSMWRFGEEEEWNLDQADGRLIFTFSDGTVVQAKAQIIGSLNTLDGTWLWAWANNTIVDSLKCDALKLHDYGVAHRIDRLTSSKWPATEDDGWNMAALACRLCERQGAYRGVAGDTLVFMTFGTVAISRPGARA